jgi:hypothetical protein
MTRERSRQNGPTSGRSHTCTHVPHHGVAEELTALLKSRLRAVSWVRDGCIAIVP